MRAIATCTLIIALCCPAPGLANAEETKSVQAEAKQCIVWSSGDRDVALKLVFMYAYNAKKHDWMGTVRLLVWGPSAKLLSVDKELQVELRHLEEVGVELLACKACADSYGVSEDLEKLGITVKYTGKLLAEMQQTGWHVLTF
jgi:hypothetical protein